MPVIVVAVTLVLNFSVTRLDNPAVVIPGLEHLAIPHKLLEILVQIAVVHLNITSIAVFIYDCCALLLVGFPITGIILEHATPTPSAFEHRVAAAGRLPIQKPGHREVPAGGQAPADSLRLRPRRQAAAACVEAKSIPAAICGEPAAAVLITISIR